MSSIARIMASTDGKELLVEDTLENIRRSLLKFPGGQVSLIKDSTTGIATIFLDHPEKRNAMSGKMMVEFRDCIEALEQWKEGEAVILRGKGLNFCSGGDLDFAKFNGTAKAGLNMTTWMQDALRRLQNLPLISVCLVHGPTLGGGAELSVFCDFIVAADNVKYGFVHGKMGIIPAWGGGVRLANRLGYSKALDLLLTSKILTAKECVDMGLAEIVVPTEVAFSKTVEWLTWRLQHDHDVIAAMKKVVLNGCQHSSNDAFRLEKLIFAPFWGSQINKDALNKNIKHQRKSHM